MQAIPSSYVRALRQKKQGHLSKKNSNPSIAVLYLGNVAEPIGESAVCKL